MQQVCSTAVSKAVSKAESNAAKYCSKDLLVARAPLLFRQMRLITAVRLCSSSDERAAAS